MTDNILILAQENEKNCLYELVSKAVKELNVNVSVCTDAMQGLTLYNQLQPVLLLVDSDIPMLNGFSLASIIKGTHNGSSCTVYLIISQLHDYLKCNVDYYITRPINTELLYSQLVRFFEKRTMEEHKKDIESAKLHQSQLLPASIFSETFSVSYIYSPFNELSGDLLDYWCGNDNCGLYGFLFDCTGHDIDAYTQTRDIRTIIRIGFEIYKNNHLSDIMQHANEELFMLYGNHARCVAAVVFYLDFEHKNLCYCSAGIPSFFTKNFNDGYIEHEMQNPLLGYEEDSVYKECNLSLEGIEEVIFASDGFSELLYKQINTLRAAKHDDVSAVFVKLQSNKK